MNFRRRIQPYKHTVTLILGKDNNNNNLILHIFHYLVIIEDKASIYNEKTQNILIPYMCDFHP